MLPPKCLSVQSVTVTVFTPGQQNPAIGTGTGNVINKGLTSDAVGGVSVFIGGVQVVRLWYPIFARARSSKWPRRDTIQASCFTK